ncbi:MAG: hypothetical protein KME14_26620 [Tildeniella torsiva UHER 1998/13D]|jgi:hypothetical protein|nr:hypothetical protein [Tildeniella torsiva UHER 1998/13D]
MTADLDLQTIHRILLDLREKGRAQGNTLELHQVSQFGDAIVAWGYLKKTQPQPYRAEVDGLVEAIGCYSLSTGAEANV